ncbi:MAG: hypothetical protein ACXVYB_00265 [Arthrobacter sp.]
MSLNWNATEAPDWDKLEWPQKESLIFSTMSVGIGAITEENCEEWYSRYLQTYLAYGWGEPYLTLQHVKYGIGLRTNVFPKETPAAFRKKLIRIIEDKAAQQLRAAKKAMEEVSNG